MSLDELKLPKSNLFKVTCRDRHDSPNYTFTWELTPEGSKILQDKEIRFPFMYILVVEEIPPKKVETHAEGCGCDVCAGHVKIVAERFFCLHEGAGQIQFCRSGEFHIYAMVVWYSGDTYQTWKHQRAHVTDSSGYYSNAIVEGAGRFATSMLQHIEEDAVKIGNTFFAKPPNPTLWWWANLWWDSKPANTCDYKKRLWFVLWAQLISIPLWAFGRALLMFLSFLGCMIIGVRPSHIHWRPMFHPFTSTFGQMFELNSKSNWAFRAKGAEEERPIPEIIVRLPFLWVLGPIGLYYIGLSIVHHPKIWMWALIWALTTVAAVLGAIFMTKVLQSRSKSVPLYYEQIPIEKPKRRRVPLKVRWLDAKGKLCLPYAK